MSYIETSLGPLYKTIGFPAYDTARGLIANYLSTRQIRYVDIPIQDRPSVMYYHFALKQGRIAFGLQEQHDKGVQIIYIMGSDLSKQVAEWFWQHLRNQGFSENYPANQINVLDAFDLTDFGKDNYV